MYYVYFMKSEKNDKVYVGSTSKNPKIRVTEHNSGSNDWSRHNCPFTLVYYETYHCKEDVKDREDFYKSGFGKQIKYIITDKLQSLGIKPR